MKSLVNSADAEKAYVGFLEFKVIVTVPRNQLDGQRLLGFCISAFDSC